MAVMFEQGKIAALGITALGLLFVIIGLATPISTSKTTVGNTVMECDSGIKDTVCKFGGTETTTDAWDADCGSDDDCKAATSMLKAGFTFCFFGILANLVFIASLVKANGFADAIPAPLGEQMPTAGLGGACVLLYLIGWACAIAAYPKRMDRFNSDVSVGAGGALLIVAWLLTIAATGLAFAGIDGDGAAASTAAPGAAAPAVEDKPVDVEAPAAEDPAAPTAEEPPAAPAEDAPAKE